MSVAVALDSVGSANEDPVLMRRLTELRERYAGLTGKGLLKGLIEDEFADGIGVVSSFGSESVALLHMVAEVDPTTPVLFLNTGKLFGESLRYRDRLQDRLGLVDVRAIGPHPADVGRLDPKGDLWARDPDHCCAIRKTAPLDRALGPFDAWITGRKRFQTASRSAMATIELQGSKFKINPLAHWSPADVDRYIDQHDLPRHPLVDDGYLSIGCMPCTDRVAPGEDPRAGRWRGQDKTECGIHLPDTFENGDGI